MDNEALITNLISNAYTQKPLEFQNDFNLMMADRLATAIDNKKIEVAQTMFADQTQVEDQNLEEPSDGEAA